MTDCRTCEFWDAVLANIPEDDDRCCDDGPPARVRREVFVKIAADHVHKDHDPEDRTWG